MTIFDGFGSLLGGPERHLLGHFGARFSNWSDYVDLFDHFSVVLQESAKMMPINIKQLVFWEVVDIAQV